MKPILAIGLSVIVVLGLIWLGIILNTASAPASNHAQNSKQGSTSMGELQKTDVVTGTGAEAKSGSNVTVGYVGTLENGQKFDSNESFNFQLGVGQVIKGWDQGVAGMKVGGERKLVIPPSLGYGSQSAGSIPPNSTLLFDVKLLKVN